MQSWCRAAAGALLAVTFAIGTAALPAAAIADDANTGDGTTSAQQPRSDARNGKSDAQAQAGVITLDEMTTVVTDSSGYHLKATVTNTSDAAWAAGRLTLSVNPMFTFNSRTDMQEWAQSESPIPTTDQLGGADVPALQPGQSADVTIDAAADAAALTRMLNWGPKPLRVTYTHDDAVAETHTFLTRSAAGLNNAETPAMRITMVLPLMSGKWTADAAKLKTLVTNSGSTTSTATNGSNATTDAAASTAVTLDGDAARLDRSLEQTIAKHGALQTIADPTYLDALAVPARAKAIMQPADFDITAYAAQDGARKRYANAGVKDGAWTADAALTHYRAALGDQAASAPTIAWQGAGQWTLKALAEARRQGYTTVVSTSDFETTDADTVHTGTTVVPTDSGDVTVLVEQRELGELAKGEATADAATAETSQAGRLARFVAQSAFYQMEQPYNERNLLVCFGEDADAGLVDAFMSAVEASPWLETTDLDTLATATPYATGDDATALVPTDAGLDSTAEAGTSNALSALTASRADITRFRDSILDRSDDATAWIDELLDAHADLALHALSEGGGADDLEADEPTALVGAQQLSGDVLGGVTITPSEAVTMVSETASMPVTVSNDTAFPVTIRVSSITDSAEIVTSRRNEVTIPARGEAQVTFTLRAAVSGSATARITLEDRTGGVFGQAQGTAIKCVLKISDKTGFIIIGLAVVLGALGLWRQFNRKKDPDE